MSLQYTIRYAIHPTDYKSYSTEQIRSNFLIDQLFKDNTIQATYAHYDRMIVGGAKPINQTLKLESFNELKSEFFLDRREIGIINVGSKGKVSVDGAVYELERKEAIYIGKGAKEVLFESSGKEPALFYFNSAPAHASYPTKKITFADAETVELGSIENANQRTIRKLIIAGKVETCQLQMGMTELKVGSVWNTMPPHTHDRRMEAYFYFDLKEGNSVTHFMGQPDDTRHIWVQNNQAVLSPPWSIHCGAGTSNYTFIWGMAGENLEYSDMDAAPISNLK